MVQKHLGIVAVAAVLVGCPRYSQQPPPRSAMDPASESAGATPASTANPTPTPSPTPNPSSTPNASRDRPRSDGARDLGNRNPTCLSGIISTVGTAAIPVARARVTINFGDGHSEAMTDDTGRFTWCTPRAVDGVRMHARVQAEKAAFVASTRELELAVGTTTELDIGLTPTQ